MFRLLARKLNFVLRPLLLGAALLAALIVISSGPLTSSAAPPSFSFPGESSWLRVQNIGQDNANLEVDYFDQQGIVAGKDRCPTSTCPPMYPGSGWTFFQRNNANLPPGFTGTSVVSSDQPFVALLAKDVIHADGRFSIGGDTLPPGAGSHRLFLPDISKRDGPDSAWNSRFVVQNLSDTVQACLTITYISDASDDEVAWEPFRAPASGTPPGALPNCPFGGMPIAPHGSIFRDPDTMSIPDHFTGAVRLELTRNGQGQGPDRQFIAATVDTFSSASDALETYRGIDENELGTEIILPLIDRQVGPSNSYSTRFQVMNKNPTRPATVTMRVDGFSLNDNNAAITHSSSFTVRGARLCDQNRDDTGSCLSVADRLPQNFVGTVRLTSTEPIAAVVERTTTTSDVFTGYRGVRPQDGSRRVLLPVLNKNYGPVGGASGWNSWFRVMVADGTSANVTVHYYGIDLPGGSIAYTQPVNREFTVYQYVDDRLPSGFAGTAVIESDKPLIAVANVFTDVYRGDTDYAYNGIALDNP